MNRKERRAAAHIQRKLERKTANKLAANPNTVGEATNTKVMTASAGNTHHHSHLGFMGRLG